MQWLLTIVFTISYLDQSILMVLFVVLVKIIKPRHQSRQYIHTSELLPCESHPNSSTRMQTVLGWLLTGTKRTRRALIGGRSSRISVMYVLLLPLNTWVSKHDYQKPLYVSTSSSASAERPCVWSHCLPITAQYYCDTFHGRSRTNRSSSVSCKLQLQAWIN